MARERVLLSQLPRGVTEVGPQRETLETAKYMPWNHLSQRGKGAGYFYPFTQQSLVKDASRKM